TPGSRTLMLIPNCEKFWSPSRSQNAERPGPAYHRESRALSTNQPSPLDTWPFSVGSGRASGTITADCQISPELSNARTLPRAKKEESPGGLRPVTGARPWKVLSPVEMPQPFLSCGRSTRVFARVTRSSLDRGNRCRRPSEGGRTPLLDRAECLETDLFNCGAHDDLAREGRGYGEEEDWEAW